MVFINGASKGIGRFLLESYLNSNETVVGTYNNTMPHDKLDNYIKLDIRNWVQVETVLEELIKKYDDITLINCSGINYNAFAHKTDINNWAEVVNINLISTFNIIRLFLPQMRAQNFGRIINFSSVVAQKGVPGTSAYAASKSALWGMTKSIAVENASKNVTINNINLGYFDIGMISSVPEEFKEIIKKQIPTGKFGEKRQILNVVEYIRNCDYLTGTSVDLNGGLI